MARIERGDGFQRINIGGSINVPDRVRPITISPIETPFRAPPSYTGRALEGLGSAVGTLAAGLQRNYDERQATADASWFSKARAQAGIDWLTKEAELRTSYGAPVADPGAGFAAPSGAGGPVPQGFSTVAAKEWEKYRDEVLKSAPSPEARLQFQQWADTFGFGVQERALEFEDASLFAVRADDLNSAFDNHVKTVYSDPDRYDDVLSLAEDDLAAAAAWMTPEQEIEARASIEEALSLARAKKLAQFDPLRFLSEVGLANDAISITAAKIIGVESSGDPSAKNPNSTATGLGQFTEGTWLQTIGKHRPDLAGRLSRNELLALRDDPALAREMTIALTRDNAAALAAAGLPATEANLYLAHFAGAEGARMILTATDDTPVTAIFSPDAIRANPVLQGGQTVGGLKRWAEGKMAGATAADMGSFADNPKYSRLSPDQVFALAADANSALVAQHNLAVTEQKAIYDARFNQLMTGIIDGTAGLSDVYQARREGWLSNYDDIQKATSAIETRDKEQIKIATALARVADPNANLNPFLEADRDDVDIAYKAMGGATGLSTGDQVSVGRLTSVVDATDIIPGEAVASLRAGIYSSKPEEMLSSMTIMDGLYRSFPAAVDRSFDEADIKRLQRYQTLAPMIPQEDLMRRMDPAMDPATRKNREELYKLGQAEAAKIDVSEILDSFDQGAFYAEGEGPIDGPQAVAMSREFNDLFAEFYSDHGNADAAKADAIEAMHRKWGVTDTGRERRVVAYPPEHRYPAVDGDHDWMGAQLEETVLAIDPGAQDWGVTPAPETEGAWGRGEMPPYYIVYVDKDGIPRTILGADGRPQLFFFEYEVARDAAREQFEIDRDRTTTGFDLENERRQQMGLPAIEGPQ